MKLRSSVNLAFLVPGTAALILGFGALVGCRQERPGIRAAGVVDGEIALVKSLVGGQLAEFRTQEGDTVRQGDVIARLDGAKLEKKLEGLGIQEREIRLQEQRTRKKIQLLLETRAYWEDKVQRLHRLTESRSVAGDELQQARLKLSETTTALFEAEQMAKELQVKLEALKNQEEQVRLQLEDYSIEAPATGVVLRKFINQGEVVFPGQSLAEILIGSSLFVETFLEEEELSHLGQAHPVEIFVDGLTQPLAGEVVYISREAEFSPKYIISEKERKSLLYRVKIRLKDGTDRLKLGMPVTVRLSWK